MPMTNILVPTDFSEHSAAAVVYAFQLASRLGARAHLLHAYDPAVSSEDAGYGFVPTESLHRAVRERMREVAAPYEREATFGTPIVVTGDPIDVILLAAKRLQADLIVVGTRSRAGLERVLLGSVAERIVREASCPTLVVKPGVWEP